MFLQNTLLHKISIGNTLLHKTSIENFIYINEYFQNTFIQKKKKYPNEIKIFLKGNTLIHENAYIVGLM